MKLFIDQSIIAAAIVAILLMAEGYWSLASIGKLVAASHSVEHTQVVIDRLQTLLTDLEDTSRGVRSGILTGNAAYRQAFDQNREKLNAEMQAVKALTADNPTRQKDLRLLGDLLDQQQDVMKDLNRLSLSKNNGFLALEIEESNQLIDQIRGQIAYMQKDERDLLRQRSAKAEAQSNTARAMILVGTGLSLCVILGSVFLLRREAVRRQRAQQDLDRFFTLTRDMLCTAGFDGYFKKLNPAWATNLGYTSEEMLALPFESFLHPDDVARTREEYARQQVGEEAINFENRYRCKDGSYRWLSWSARPLVDEEIIYASARDLTERKLMEEKLQASEEQARLMVENVRDYSIILLDTKGHVVSWNEGAERIKGYKAQEIIGRHFSCFYPEDKIREGFPERELETAKTCGRFEDEGWRVRKDGSRFWANVVVTAVRNENDELLGFIKITRDITDQKAADERIQNLNDELKERAEQLEGANKELEAFSYSVSHDLRAPLRHIHGFVEILQKSPAIQGDEKNQRYMTIISNAARDMGRLIDDLLALSRTGRAEMHPVPVDMRQMVDEVIRELEPEWKGRRVDWDIKPLSHLCCDPSLFRLVWANLIANALKYSRPRPVAKIEIGIKDGDRERETVFYVSDNGVGFDMTYVGKLFGVFQRLHRAEEFEGTGIGLANVQRIIHRHGGRVWAEGRVDAGATFNFSLPHSKPQPAQSHVEN